MRILGIETVTKIGSLAIIEDGAVLGQTTIDTHLNHASNLIGSLDNLLHSCNLNLKDIDAIAVDTGPGSFTGIRVGISSAIGLAQPDDKILVAVCSLEVLTMQIKKSVKTKNLVPVLDAKRGSIYSAVYRIKDRKIKAFRKPYAVKVEDIPHNIPNNSFVFGPDIRRYSGNIQKMEAVDVDTHNTYPSAAVVALLGEIKIKESSVKKSLEPMYIHTIEYRK